MNLQAEVLHAEIEYMQKRVIIELEKRFIIKPEGFYFCLIHNLQELELQKDNIYLRSQAGGSYP